MRSPILLRVAVFLILPLSLAAAGRSFTVTGVVRAPLTDGRIVVAHDEIVGYMPAMTMAFDVAGVAMADAARLAPGERVRFRLHVDAEQALADRFETGGPEAAAAPRASVETVVPRLHEGDRMPDFALVDEQDRPLTRESLVGHATLITFVFTRCPVPEFCPAMAHRFASLQRIISADAALAGRVQLLGITLDPDFDRPLVLAAYARAVGAKSAVWRFATGEKEQIAGLTKAFSVYVERDGVTLNHTLCTALVARDGEIVGIWRGNGWTQQVMLAAIRRAAAN